MKATGLAVAGATAATAPSAPFRRGRTWRGFGLRYARYVARRLAWAVPVVIVIIIINFLLIHLAPGNPVYALVGDSDTSPEYIAQMRHEFGLDRPLIVQLGIYLARVAQLDLGYSFRFQEPVFALIMGRLPGTLLLMGTALVLSSLFGVLLGILAARRPHGVLDQAATVVALAGYSMPVFWLGQLLLLMFAFYHPWFPVQGMVSILAPSHGWGRITDIARHLVLPATVYGSYNLTLIYRLTRVKMMEILVQDYVTTARAKGVVEIRVLLRHALPNAVLPVITVIGQNLGFMLAGSVLVETVFGWPGMGNLMFQAIEARDYPLLLGLLLVVSVFVIIGNIITDVVYAMVDPRILYR